MDVSTTCFNSEPSNEDITITRKLVECGKILKIPFYDHIIFAGNQFTSFVEKRLTWKPDE